MKRWPVAPGNQRRRGFVLLATAVGMVVMFGSLGLVADLGRGWIAQNEAQAFTDSAALAASTRLNGTLAGISAAKAEVAASVNKWYFGTKSLTGVITEFSIDRSTWVADPGTGSGYKFARVRAPSNHIQGLFSTVLSSRNTITVGALTVAGNQPPTSASEGVFPFAPIAHNPTGPHFGYTYGDELTLLWPSSVQSSGGAQQLNNLCQSDRNQASLDAINAGTTADRGYIQETSASSIAAAIEDDHMDYTVTVGLPVARTGGVKTTDVYQSLEDRVNQDTSKNVQEYTAYLANHDSTPYRRIVIVPIVGDAVNAIVLGFVKVFLPPNQQHNPNKSKCAMYIGPADTPTGNNGSGGNFLRIVQ